jgi:hypothetical protein
MKGDEKWLWCWDASDTPLNCKEKDRKWTPYPEDISNFIEQGWIKAKRKEEEGEDLGDEDKIEIILNDEKCTINFNNRIQSKNDNPKETTVIKKLKASQVQIIVKEETISSDIEIINFIAEFPTLPSNNINSYLNLIEEISFKLELRMSRELKLFLQNKSEFKNLIFLSCIYFEEKNGNDIRINIFHFMFLRNTVPDLFNSFNLNKLYIDDILLQLDVKIIKDILKKNFCFYIYFKLIKQKHFPKLIAIDTILSDQMYILRSEREGYLDDTFEFLLSKLKDLFASQIGNVPNQEGIEGQVFDLMTFDGKIYLDQTDTNKFHMCVNYLEELSANPSLCTNFEIISLLNYINFYINEEISDFIRPDSEGSEASASDVEELLTQYSDEPGPSLPETDIQIIQPSLKAEYIPTNLWYFYGDSKWHKLPEATSSAIDNLIISKNENLNVNVKIGPADYIFDTNNIQLIQQANKNVIEIDTNTAEIFHLNRDFKQFTTYCWEYASGDTPWDIEKDCLTFSSYEAKTSSDIEKGYNEYISSNGPNRIEIDVETKVEFAKYIIDFKTMHQINKSDRYKMRPIRRSARITELKAYWLFEYEEMKFVGYRPDISDQLEEAFITGKLYDEVIISENIYVVRFDSMIQFNKTNPYKQRKVRRKLDIKTTPER